MASYLAGDEHLKRVVAEVCASYPADTSIYILVNECMNRTIGDRFDSDTDGEYRTAFTEIITTMRCGPEKEAVRMTRFFRDAYKALVATAKAKTTKELAQCRSRATYQTLWRFNKATRGKPVPRATFIAYLRMLRQAERELTARDETLLAAAQEQRQGRLLRFPQPPKGGGDHESNRRGGSSMLPF